MATSPLLSTFQQVVSAWSLVASSNSLESQPEGLVAQLSQSVGKLDMFTTYQIDCTNFTQGSCVSACRGWWVATQPGLHSSWLLCSIAWGFRGQLHSVVECVGATVTVGEGNEVMGGKVEDLTLPTSKLRHCRLIPLTR